jgi:hypothetical protein
MPALCLDTIIENMNKEIRKEVRISENELKVMLRKAKLLNMNFSQYIRHVGIRSKLFTIVPIINDNMLSELSRVANNLNQISKALHGPNKELYIINEHDSIIADFYDAKMVFNSILEAHKEYLKNPYLNTKQIDN